jgi:hypothetical protein
MVMKGDCRRRRQQRLRLRDCTRGRGVSNMEKRVFMALVVCVRSERWGEEMDFLSQTLSIE